MIPREVLMSLVLLLAELAYIQGQLIFPHDVSRKPRKNANKIVEVEASCTKDTMDIRVNMERPFKGVVFTKDFARECKTQGNLEKSVILHLPPNACGVRVSSLGYNETYDDVDQTIQEGLFYVVTVVVQMDKFLQQSSDEERVVKCWLKPKVMQIKSFFVEEMLERKLKEIIKYDKSHTRSGRMGNEWREISEEQQASLMEKSRAWMEILPSNGNVEATSVEVGEPTMIVIKSTLPAGVGLRITDCLAHDGLGETSQKLLDEMGCPVDELIFPKMRIYSHRPISERKHRIIENGRIKLTEVEERTDGDEENTYKYIMSYQHATTIFPAFKFPDRARLHLTCGIELCKGECPNVDCKQIGLFPKSKDSLTRKVRLDKETDGAVIDRLQVYNSIEVLAPNIELEDDVSITGSRRFKDIEQFLSTTIPDKTVCMSPSKMALSFCVLGLVFLTALVVAFVSLIRTKRKCTTDPFGGLSFYAGSKSLFSGSGSSNSGFSGSKLLLTESPYLDHQSTSSHWPYGRVH